MSRTLVIKPKTKISDNLIHVKAQGASGGLPQQKEIITVNSAENLPSVGSAEYIYRVVDEKCLYQWNDETRQYELISGTSAGGNAYSSLTKIKDYFYCVRYTDIDEDYAIEYFKSKKPIINASGCTSFVRDGKYVRFFDWTYDNNSEFLVYTPARGSRYSVMGVASSLPLSKEFVESEEYSELYKLVPFYLTDGINECGLVMSTNVVPIDYGKTTGTVPLIEKRAEICSIMLIRYILERCSTARQAVEMVRDYISVFVPQGLHRIGFEQHFMISDGSKTYCLEFINNRVSIVEHNIMTNFFLSGADLSGLIYTSADVPSGHLPSSQGITPYGEGLERYNIIKSSSQPIENIIDNLLYTNTYKRGTYPFWYSEYVGGELTVDNPPVDFTDRINSYIAAFERRTREDENPTWQTVHCSIYDFKEKNLSVKVQEEAGFSEPYGAEIPIRDTYEFSVEDEVLNIVHSKR